MNRNLIYLFRALRIVWLAAGFFLYWTIYGAAVLIGYVGDAAANADARSLDWTDYNAIHPFDEKGYWKRRFDWF